MSVMAVVSFVAVAWPGTWPAIIAATIVAASIKYQQYQTEKQRDLAEKAADEAKGFQLTVEGQVMNLPLVYGRARIGGNRVFHKVDSDYTFANVGAGGIVLTSSGDGRELNTLFNSITPTAGKAIMYYIPRSVSVVTKGCSGSLAKGYYIRVPINEDWSGDCDSSRTRRNTGVTESLTNLTIVSNLTRVNPGSTEYNITFQSGLDTDQIRVGTKMNLTHPPFLTYDAWNLQEGNENTAPPTSSVYKYKVVSYNSGNGATVLEVLDLDQIRGTAEISLNKSKNGKKNQFLFVTQVLCLPGISEIYGAFVNDRDWRDPDFGRSIRMHCYADGDVSDPLFAANDSLGSTSKYPQAAYAFMVFKLDRDEPQFSGVPDAQFFVEGMKIKSIDNNAEVYTLSTSKTYSNNPAYVLLDYLLSDVYGKGLPVARINLKSFWKAAQVYDVIVEVNGSDTIEREGLLWKAKGSTRQLRRFECNLIIDTEKDVRDNIAQILKSIPNAAFIWSNGQYKIIDRYPVEWVAGTYQIGDTVQYDSGTDLDLWRATAATSDTPTDGSGDWERGPLDEELVAAYLTDDDIILDGEIGTAWPALSTRYNHCEISYLNESDDFETGTVEWPPQHEGGGVFDTYLNQDNGIHLFTDKSAVGATTEFHARAVAEEIVRRSRHLKTTNITVAKEFLYLEPGDIIHLSSAELQIPYDLFLVTETKAKADGNLELTIDRYDARILAWNAPDDEIIVPRNQYLGPLQQVTGLTFSVPDGQETGIAGILTWDPLPLNSLQQYDVYYAIDTVFGVNMETEWIHMGSTATNRFVVPALLTFEENDPHILTVVPQTVGGRRAPQEDWAMGSFWPVVAFVPVSSGNLLGTAVTLNIYVYAKTDRIGEIVPPGGSYDFTTATPTPPVGFYPSTPAALSAAGGGPDPGDLYFATASLLVEDDETVIEPITWSNLELFDPIRVTQPFKVFHRRPAAGAVPVQPNEDGTYDFTLGVGTVPTGNVTWYLEDDLPDGIGVIYQTNTTFARLGNYGFNTNVPVWSFPRLHNATGALRAKLSMYQWSSTPPTFLAGAQTTYDWLDGGHGDAINMGDWTFILTTNPGGIGVKLWIAEIEIESEATALIATVDWDADGSIRTTDAGNVPGGKNTTVNIYHWAASTPSSPVTDSTYTWDTGILTNLPVTPQPWYEEPPAPILGNTLYKIEVKLQEEGSVSASTVYWSNFSILAVGYAGATGEDGAEGNSGEAGVSARRAYALQSSSFSPGNQDDEVVTGDELPDAEVAFPWSGTSVWQYGANITVGANEAIFQSDGFYDPNSNQTIWQAPYISSLKVGALSALAVSTGQLSVNDVLTMASGGVLRSALATSVDDGDGFWLLDVDGVGDVEFRVGTDIGDQDPKFIKYDGGDISMQSTNLRINEDGIVVGDFVGDGKRIVLDNTTNEIVGFNTADQENFRLGAETGVDNIILEIGYPTYTFTAISAKSKGTAVVGDGLATGVGGLFTAEEGIALEVAKSSTTSGSPAMTIEANSSGGHLRLKSNSVALGSASNGTITNKDGALYFRKSGVWGVIPTGNRSVGQAEMKTALAYQSAYSSGNGLTNIALTGGNWTMCWFLGTYDSSGWRWRLSTTNSTVVVGKRTDGHANRMDAFSRYVQASPPYNMGDGDIPLFIYLLVDNATKQIRCHSIAQDPFWAYHGPTNIATAAIKASGPNKLRVPLWRAEGRNIENVLKSGSSKKIRELMKEVSKNEYVEMDATHKYKNTDMNSHPHPFQKKELEGCTALLLDPMSPVTQELADYLTSVNDLSDASEESDILSLFNKGYLKFGNEKLNRKGPEGVTIVSVGWS